MQNRVMDPAPAGIASMPAFEGNGLLPLSIRSTTVLLDGVRDALSSTIDDGFCSVDF